MPNRSKRSRFLSEKVKEIGVVSLPQAVEVLKGLEETLPKQIKPCKFDQSVEIAIRLGVDPKQADQIVRGSIVLPNGIGKSQRVLVFASGKNVAAAEEAGADYVGRR